MKHLVLLLFGLLTLYPHAQAANEIMSADATVATESETSSADELQTSIQEMQERASEIQADAPAEATEVATAVEPATETLATETLPTETTVTEMTTTETTITEASTTEAPAVAPEAPVSSLPKARVFTLNDTQGNGHALSDYKGKYVVLEWYNSECPFVQKYYNSNSMQKLQKKYTDQGVVWLTIASSAPGKQGFHTPDEHNKMIQEKSIASTALLIDEGGDAARMYDAKTTPHMYVVNPEGYIIYRGAIDSKPSTEAKDIAGATNYVEQALSEAMAGKEVSTPETQPYGCAIKN